MSNLGVNITADNCFDSFTSMISDDTISVHLEQAGCGSLGVLFGAAGVRKRHYQTLTKILEYIADNAISFTKLVEIRIDSGYDRDLMNELPSMSALSRLPALKKLWIDWQTHLVASEAFIQSLESLSVEGRYSTSIDLTGIEFMSELKYLRLSGLRILNLSLISHLSNLKALWIASNSLQSLDLSGVHSLEELSILSESLTTLILSPSAKPKLISLGRRSNLKEVINLDPSDLQLFIAKKAGLTSLEFLTGAHSLTTLLVDGNPLTHIPCISSQYLRRVYLGYDIPQDVLLTAVTKDQSSVFGAAYIILVQAMGRENYRVLCEEAYSESISLFHLLRKERMMA